MAHSGIIVLAAILLLSHWSFQRSQAQLITRFLKPCFEEDKHKELGQFCSEPNGECSDELANSNKDENFKLVRIDGFKKGHVQEVDLNEERNFTMITKAMKPLMFELPNFLTNEECDHIISIAKDSGLRTSIAGFNESVYDGDLSKELDKVESNETPSELIFAKNFSTWDRNNDNKIDTKEIVHFTARNRLLFIADDDIPKMFDKIKFHGYKDGVILEDDFKELNIAKLMTYLEFLKNKHPKYRARFSEQAWLPQNTKADPALRGLHERVIKLTKLPRKIVQGGEALQVVRYGVDGHYHVHYDSMPFADDYTEALPCCHHNVSKLNGCRLCRFITILYYLNDVQQGGETAFIVADNATFAREVLTKPNANDPDDNFNLSVNCHKANLVVPPKKGTAVMWYNHFIDEDSNWLGPLDPYTLHGGCDVIKGEKWIANNWLTAPPAGRESLSSVYDVGFE